MKIFLAIIIFCSGVLHAYTMDDRVSYFDSEKSDMNKRVTAEMRAIFDFYSRLGLVDANVTKKLSELKIILSRDINMLADGKMGEYNSTSNVMTINNTTLSEFNVLRFKDTLSHEMLHMIQFSNSMYLIGNVKKPKLYRLEGEAQFFSYLYLLSQKITKEQLDGEIVRRKTPFYLDAFRFYMKNFEVKYWEKYESWQALNPK